MKSFNQCEAGDGDELCKMHKNGPEETLRLEQNTNLRQTTDTITQQIKNLIDSQIKDRNAQLSAHAMCDEISNIGSVTHNESYMLERDNTESMLAFPGQETASVCSMNNSVRTASSTVSRSEFNRWREQLMKNVQPFMHDTHQLNHLLEQRFASQENEQLEQERKLRGVINTC